MQPSRCVELVGQKGPHGQAGWLMAFRAGGLIHFSLEVLQMFSGGQLDHGKCDECAGSSMLHPHRLPGLCVHCQALKSSLSYSVRANISCKGEHNPSSPRPNWNNWNPFFLHSANLPRSPRTSSVCVSQTLELFPNSSICLRMQIYQRITACIDQLDYRVPPSNPALECACTC